MKHVGIIAELNPFHNGHAYLLQTVKKLFPEKNIITVISGDYVQRGEPAVFSKYIRTKCALCEDADIVLELPSVFATASAEYFADAAVTLLAATGIVDTLCFGVESDCLDTMQEVAAFLVEEPVPYRKILKEKLHAGYSYAKARSEALSLCMPGVNIDALLHSPNNILAVEYLKAIKKHGLTLTPIAIPRKSAGHHDREMSGTVCSASALRLAYMQSGGISDDMRPFLPERTQQILSRDPYAAPLFWNDFMPYLQYALSFDFEPFDHFLDVHTDTAHALADNRTAHPDFEGLVNSLSGKHMPQSRIRRGLLNIMLRQTREDIRIATCDGHPAYSRLLGFRKDAAPLLKQIKQRGALPIINKVADAHTLLSEDAASSFALDIQKSHLYRFAFWNKYGLLPPTEYEKTVIIQET